MPLVGMQRYLSGDGPFDLDTNPEIEAVVGAFPLDTPAWIWSKAKAEDGKKTDSVKHGDFDNNSLTLGSLDHIIRQGF